MAGQDRRSIRRGYAVCGDRLVHYRRAGEGPPVVLLHDSPRSSVLHLPLLREFSDEFSVYALDTPGYGQSDPLPADPAPAIDDFGDALAGAIGTLGLSGATVYAYHTSSKVALSCALRHTALIGHLVIDGISLPPEQVPEAFISAYMSPFDIDAEGAYIGRQWTKIRDLHRFFPWFRREVGARIPMDEPSLEAMHAYAMDLFMAGPNYSSAYAAAMRYRALEVLPHLETPTTFMARANDVLYGYLDTVERCLPPRATVQRLPADDAVWREQLRALFRQPVGRPGPVPAPVASDRKARRRYVGLDHGQVHLHESGGGAAAVLLLHDPPGSGLDVQDLAAALDGLRIVAPDLPGCAASDPLPAPAAADDFAHALLALMDAEGIHQFAILALGLSGPLALALVAAAGDRVTGLALDGMPVLDADSRGAIAGRYAPAILPARDGAHFLSTWHRLRDEQLQFPWFDGTQRAARRAEPDLDAWRLHHRLLATLMQPERYGDACRAALSCDPTDPAMRPAGPVLAFEVDGDPRYQGVAKWCRGLPQGRCEPRPVALSRTARILRDFFRSVA
ncbi:MAG: hypothetical protein AMJ58_04925 [Gammaproteobacteria bacterium SG8_30]|nr:MAG: hypothetical protein AMJ58_04925 [Gammaproteobacteria bacterium SG8_30]